MGAENTIRVIFKAVDQMTGPTKKAKMGLDDLAKNVGIATAALGSLAIAAKQAFDFAQEGAQMLRLEQASEDLALSFGQNMGNIVRVMREASMETVDDMTLMGAAARALQLGVADTPSEFEKLTKASIALGRAMGRGPAEAIDDIVTGIGRMSPLILDNLGIMTNGGKVFDDYAKSVGKTADQLSDAEKKQALLNVTLQSAMPLLDETGNLAGDAATAFDQLSAKYKNWIDNLKQGMAEFALAELNALEPARQFELAMQAQGWRVESVWGGACSAQQRRDHDARGVYQLLQRCSRNCHKPAGH